MLVFKLYWKIHDFTYLLKFLLISLLSPIFLHNWQALLCKRRSWIKVSLNISSNYTLVSEQHLCNDKQTFDIILVNMIPYMHTSCTVWKGRVCTPFKQCISRLICQMLCADAAAQAAYTSTSVMWLIETQQGCKLMDEVTDSPEYALCTLTTKWLLVILPSVAHLSCEQLMTQ